MTSVHDLAIVGGRCVLPTGVAEANLGIADGLIATVSGDAPEAREVIRADGLLVLPGFIDTHMHLGYHDEASEFDTETRAALVGGLTTLLVYYRRLTAYGDDLAGFIARGNAQSSVDFAIHLGMLTDDHLESAPRLSERFGIRSYKMYTCYKDGELAAFGVRGEDDGFILDAMHVLSAIPGSVVNVHCENEELYQRRLGVLKRGGHAGKPLEQWSWARPPLGEAEAIQRVALFARDAGARLHIPHVGSAAAVAACLDARAAGTDLTAETCPHYLLLTDAADGHAQYAKVNPPVRSDTDRRRMVAAVADGGIDTVGTDHAAITLDGKRRKEVWQARPGFPGVDVMVPAMMELVHRGEMPIERVAAVSARSADRFGLPGKGRIEVGRDADLVLIDPDEAHAVSARALLSVSDLSVYEGMVLHGWPSATVLRGKVAARDGRPCGEPPAGRYLRRDPEA